MDFYLLLGVEREASTTDIKRAYRRLARRLHPDINPGDRDAEAQFRKVLDAYETLVDPDRRRRYDSGALGRAAAPVDRSPAYGFAGFDFSQAPDPHRATTFGELFEEVFARRAGAVVEPARGADLHLRASLSFDEAWRGGQRRVTLTRHETCHACAGSGFQRSVESPCVACEGSGVVRSARGHMVFAKNCPHCEGAGRLRQLVCATCHGQGVEMRVEAVVVRIPAGVADGARIRAPGKGHAGTRGGPPGDLFLTVDVRAHPSFTRDGDNLHTTIGVAIHEAALGARIDISTPDGPARLRVPPGTQSGQRFRLRDRGAPTADGRGRGDLVVEVRLMLPAVLDERSKELLREFGRINSEAVGERSPLPPQP
ncbi:MAG: molecular chaperone DnaJ [Acidobacteriota bacterium]